ncbi:MAG: hypothetical protein K2N94_09225, partial [Lachnospiraceae bacterium]|nr:hypothetical protein [Lachnospiraceae bacterium]
VAKINQPMADGTASGGMTGEKVPGRETYSLSAGKKQGRGIRAGFGESPQLRLEQTAKNRKNCRIRKDCGKPEKAARIEKQQDSKRTQQTGETIRNRKPAELEELQKPKRQHKQRETA